MPRTIQTVLNVGSTGLLVDIECQLSNGLPGITLVGLGGKAVEESRERVRSAFAGSQIPLPRKRITINLAPADVPKESTSLDLAIALAILAADGQLKHPLPEQCAVFGELGLDGNVRAVRGIIGKLLSAKHLGITTFILPRGNLRQAQLIPDIRISSVTSLSQLLQHINAGELSISATNLGQTLPGRQTPYEYHLYEVVGQHKAKRAMEIAAAGGHNVFLNGPPGTGKSMLARALPSILPELTREETLEITQLHSLVNGNYEDLVTIRPFRSPHHSTSHVAIVGGGNSVRPGEISLAHRGVLLLDEFPEFARMTIESLRQPLEDRVITVARARETAVYPANFILVATANPCPCGYFGTSKPCTCPAHAIVRYRQKLSGPIMDRIDLYADVQEVEHAKLLTAIEDNDQAVQSRVKNARRLQAERYGNVTKLNADMNNRDIKNKSRIEPETTALLNDAAQSLDLSARSYMRIIKVARTIADLDGSQNIKIGHITEALQYRRQNLQTIA